MIEPYALCERALHDQEQACKPSAHPDTMCGECAHFWAMYWKETL